MEIRVAGLGHQPEPRARARAATRSVDASAAQANGDSNLRQLRAKKTQTFSYTVEPQVSSTVHDLLVVVPSLSTARLLLGSSTAGRLRVGGPLASAGGPGTGQPEHAKGRGGGGELEHRRQVPQARVPQATFEYVDRRRTRSGLWAGGRLSVHNTQELAP
jgi:hypothetical protein